MHPHGGSSDLAHFINTALLFDTHEHLKSEEVATQFPPDVLFDLFSNYVTADLVVAGATQQAVDRLIDPTDRDVHARFAPVQKAWEACRHTGYGEAVRLIARQVYGMEEITPAAIEASQGKAAELRLPGKRLEMLQQANIDHVQVDDFCWACVPDLSGPDFFLYDLSWASFSNGQPELQALHEAVGIEVRDLETLRAAMATLFARYGPCAIAVKSQHAYSRTLRWEEREEADVARVLARVLAGEQNMDESTRCVLGDWCLARGVEFAAEYNLPFKIHTGYYAGYGRMPVDRIPSGHLSVLLARYPNTRFVLMHIAYPYSEELIALAKHYPNVWVDLCWAWSINPYATTDFVRRFVHAVPANKLFGFGGDSGWPAASIAYAHQARQGLRQALEAEVAEGLLSEKEALTLAERFMQRNQQECFDLVGTRQAIQEAMKKALPD